MRILLYNSHTAYIQILLSYTYSLFNPLVFVLVEEEILFCGVVGP